MILFKIIYLYLLFLGILSIDQAEAKKKGW